MSLTNCSEIHYEVKEGVHGVTFNFILEDESRWTPIVGKKTRRRVSDFIKCRFPPDHPAHTTNSPESGNDYTSEEDPDAVIPAGANVQFKVVDNAPGFTITTRNTMTWTPIATRTRASLKR